jgi:hypothetical protein
MAGLDPATHCGVSTPQLWEVIGAQTRACWVAASRAAMVSILSHSFLRAANFFNAIV